MKKILIISVLIINLFITSTTFAASSKDIERLISAMEFVESSNRLYVKGDNGKSWGILQISKGVILDVNETFGDNYKHEDAFSRELSREICRKYIRRYSRYFKKVKGRSPTIEEIAHLWNGGLSAMLNPNSMVKNYWTKVSKQLGA